MYYVYFLKSIRNGKIYTGRTEKKPEERLKEHNYGSNTFTRENGPFELVYFEEYHCQKDQIKREEFYKTGVGRAVRNAILSVHLNRGSASAKGGPASGGG